MRTFKEYISYVFVSALFINDCDVVGKTGKEIAELINSDQVFYDAIENCNDVFGDFELEEVCDTIEEYYKPEFLAHDPSQNAILRKYSYGAVMTKLEKN